MLPPTKELMNVDKEKSTEKIHGAITTIMAHDHAIRCGNNSSASVYYEKRILFLQIDN